MYFHTLPLNKAPPTHVGSEPVLKSEKDYDSYFWHSTPTVKQHSLVHQAEKLERDRRQVRLGSDLDMRGKD